jgi:hypothetical protein
MGLIIPWDPDGQSVFTPTPPSRDRIAMIPDKQSFGSDIDPDFLSLQRKIQLFGARNLDGLYLMGPHPEIVGRAISSFLLVQSQEKAQFIKPKYRPGPPKTARVQAYVEGSLSNHLKNFDVESTKIAIAVNGTIVNTTHSTSLPVSELGKGKIIDGHSQIEKDAKVHFLARIPLNRWRSVENYVSVHVIIEDSAGNPVSLINFSKEP